ncbi:MAG: stage II sporulation protein M [Acidobacteriota bacterium]
MNQDLFVAHNEATWRRAESVLEKLESRTEWDVELAELPTLYRRVCHHLSLVRQRHYGAGLEQRLHDIALRGYRQLYGKRPWHWRRAANLLFDFPALVRARAGLFWLATALFDLPTLAMGGLVLAEPDAIYSLVSPEQVAEYESMYRTRDTEERGAAADFAMFGFYIYNNISIAFRTFASGLFAGLGTLFILVFNGLFLGGLMAHMVHAESAVNLTSFVITHGAFELTAIVLAGVAGLRLGGAVIAPGRYSRGEALRRAGGDCAYLIGGVTVMLVIAAVIEAFWSSSAWIPPAGKYASGALAWAAVFLYLGLAGRGREGRFRDRGDPTVEP